MRPPHTSVIIGSFVIIVLYLCIQHLRSTLLIQAPELFPLDTNSAFPFVITPDQTVTQQFTTPEKNLKQLDIAYDQKNLSSSGVVKIDLHIPDFSPVVYQINTAQLANSSIVNLEIPAHLSISAGTSITISIRSTAPSFTFYQTSNSWLAPHRFNGRLTLNNQIQPLHLVFRPHFSKPLNPSQYIHIFAEIRDILEKSPRKINNLIAIFFLMIISGALIILLNQGFSSQDHFYANWFIVLLISLYLMGSAPGIAYLIR